MPGILISLIINCVTIASAHVASVYLKWHFPKENLKFAGKIYPDMALT